MRKGFLISFWGIILISCTKKEGCMDIGAINYDATAEKENNSCTYKGFVTFWVKNASIVNTVDVTVNGITNTITTHYPDSSACWAPGCATFEFEPGNYNFHANERATSHSWDGQISISSKGCTLKELKY